MHTRGVVAMAGSFGYELDLNTLNDEDKEMVKKQVAEYKGYYDLVHQGDYYRLNCPDQDEFASWLFVSKDQTQALFNVVVTRVRANHKPVFVKLKGLDAAKNYVLSDGRVLSGAALMYAGLCIPSESGDYRAVQIELKAE